MAADLPPGVLSADLNEDARFLFPASDEYWVPGVTVGQRLYEPEIDWFLQRAAVRPYVLFDCGANMGYWSVIASSAPYGSHPAIAIEAGGANFEMLSMNARANRLRFAILHRAIAGESGKLVPLYGKRHYGMSLRTDWRPADNDTVEEVESITLDDVARTFAPQNRHPALIKLDVEGSEIEALKGARGLIDLGALFIYEDHGKEPAHPVSRFVLAQDDIEVWWLAPEQQPARIKSIEQVAAIKQDARMGYNFFGCGRASPWAALFEG
jgi:FkbM family methyltransferase